MIKTLQLQNFKCFQQHSFNFSKINLLTGINGRGKSSLLQSLLLISQSAMKDYWLSKLFINGSLLTLGNFDDIKNSDTARGENIHFKFTTTWEEINELNFEFTENYEDALLANVEEIAGKTYAGDTFSLQEVQFLPNSIYDRIALLFGRIHFVSADRLGPVRFVEKTNLPEFVHVGVRGEHTTSILAHLGLSNLVDDRLYLGNDSKSLLQQTEEWLNYILDGAKVEIRGKEKDSSVLSMLLNSRSGTAVYKPTNVGFGYSYILPLIVTGLIAQEGEIVIIENPEAHLHPRAQSRITEFFAKVAACGVQVFIESHSEHILNGLRVSALKKDIEIAHSDIIIQYFNEQFGADELSVEIDGKIKNWPEGFFDQQEIDLSNIFKLSR